MADSRWTRRRNIRKETDEASRELNCACAPQISNAGVDNPNSRDVSGFFQDTSGLSCSNCSFEQLEHEYDIDVDLGDRYSSDSSSSDSESVGCDGDAGKADPELLNVLLADWALQFSTPLASLGALLKILKPFHTNLPLDPRTLLKTPRCSAVRTISGGGQYAHFGLQRGLVTLIKSGTISRKKQTLELQFNVDGLPLFKSSSITLWPILCLIRNCSTSKPFTVGCFCGEMKPTDLNDYFAEFIAELQTLLTTGIEFENVQFDLRIHSFVCDTPARALIKRVKGHSGYYGCDKCHVEGEWHGKMTFQSVSERTRTDAEFAQQTDVDHHLAKSPLSLLPVGMVSQFPLDYMHLVCLGVVRRLLLCWIKGALSIRLSATSVQKVSDQLVRLSSFVPKEFVRKPRSLNEVMRWKATEFRTFLLYTGPIVLRGVLRGDLYDNFMYLSVALTILLSPKLCSEYCDYAKQLLTVCVSNMQVLYGEGMMVYNVHALIHLADDAQKFGALDNISSFPFENALKSLKKLVRKPAFPLQQICRRIEEQLHRSSQTVSAKASAAFQEHHCGPVPDELQHARQYKQLCTDGFTLSVNVPDNCVKLDDGSLCFVKNIVEDKGSIYIIVDCMKKVESFFTKPLPSANIGIDQFIHRLTKLKAVSLQHVHCKCVSFCIAEDKFVCFPVLHSL
jgi:hypothetical protein